MKFSLAKRLSVALTLFVTLFLTNSSSAAAAPPIQWTPAQVNNTIGITPGQVTSEAIAVSFTSSTPLDRITFEVVGPLSDFVTVQPAEIDNVQAGVVQPITLRLILPAGVDASKLGGVLHVKSGRRTVPQSLRIRLSIAQVLLGTDLPTTNTNAELAVLFSQTLAQRFTLTSPASIGTIKLQLSGFGVDQLTMRVTNSLGPGTTQANVLLERTLTFPNTGGGINGSTVSVPVELDLEPGDYFIVLSSSQVSALQGWLISTTTLPSTVGTVGELRFSPAFLPPFPPDTFFFPVGTAAAAFQLLP